MDTSFETDIYMLFDRLEDTNPIVRTDTIVLLQDIADLRATRPLTTLLEDPDVNVRAAAAGALGSLGDDRSIPALIACSADPDKHVRRAALLALKLLVKSARQTDVFLDALGDVDRGIQLLAVQASSALGDRRATMPLVEISQQATGAIWRNAVTGLGKLGDTRALAPLLDLLKTVQEDAQKRNVISALGQLGDSRALTTITKDVYSGTPSIRVQSIIALGALRDRSTFELLRDLAHDPVPDIRAAAARALGMLGDPRAVPVLRLLLGDRALLPTYITVDEIAANALHTIGTAEANLAVEAWALYIIHSGREEIVTIRALRKLQDLRSPRTLQPLLNLLQTQAADVRAEAALVLGHLGDMRAVAPLLDMAQNDLERVRPDALYALALLGDRRAVCTFVDALDDPYLPIRVEGALGLAAFMDNRAVPTLTALLNNRKRFISVHRPDYLGDYARDALHRMDTPDARMALQFWQHSLM